MALQHVKHCNIAKVIIFSDSLSCLQAIKSCQLKNPLILDILELHDSLTTSEIIFCWLPGHVGIKGNTLADAAPISPMSIPYSILNMLLVLILNRYTKKNGIMKHIINYIIFKGVYCRGHEDITVKHILLDCADFSDQRLKVLFLAKP